MEGYFFPNGFRSRRKWLVVMMFIIRRVLLRVFWVWFSLVGVVQLASGACFIFLIATGIMMHPLFLCGVVVFAMITTSTSTVITLPSASSTRQERNATAVIARAMPKLTTLSGIWIDRFHAHIVWSIYDFSFLWREKWCSMIWYDKIWLDTI